MRNIHWTTVLATEFAHLSSDMADVICEIGREMLVFGNLASTPAVSAELKAWSYFLFERNREGLDLTRQTVRLHYWRKLLFLSMPFAAGDTFLGGVGWSTFWDCATLGLCDRINAWPWVAYNCLAATSRSADKKKLISINCGRRVVPVVNKRWGILLAFVLKRACYRQTRWGPWTCTPSMTLDWKLCSSSI